ncbi:MAG: hypothetical protein ABJG42_20520 [Vibrio splendidus]
MKVTLLWTISEHCDRSNKKEKYILSSKMMFSSIPRAGVFGLCLVALVSCDEASLSGQNSFQSQYSSAREALEKGKFEQATRLYIRLMDNSGALTPRIRLELAHAYLRSGAFAKAAIEARNLAKSQKGSARAAALAVQGTAEHELALAALTRGELETAKPLLQNADRAMAEVLKTDAKLDPLGSLAGRRASIRVQLKNL